MVAVVAVVAVVKVETLCEGERVESTEFNITFFEYKEYCGGDCYCEVGIERSGCFFKFRNSLDTKVDLDTTASLNGVPLPSYNYLGKVTEIPAQALKYGVEASVPSLESYDFKVDDAEFATDVEPFMSPGINIFWWKIFPPYKQSIQFIDTSNIKSECGYRDWETDRKSVV